MNKVSIVVGHQPSAKGASNKTFNVYEYDFNNELAALIAHECDKLGISNVVVYRDTYEKLPAKINSIGSEVCIELHCNAYNTRARGTETLYWGTSTKGKRLASLIQSQMVDSLNIPDRGIKPLDASSRGAHLLRGTVAPCVILESGFIDNDVDYLVLSKHKTCLAHGIALGLQEYFN